MFIAASKQNKSLLKQNIKRKSVHKMFNQVNTLENRLTTLEDFVANDNCTCDYVQVGQKCYKLIKYIKSFKKVPS